MGASKDKPFLQQRPHLLFRQKLVYPSKGLDEFRKWAEYSFTVDDKDVEPSNHPANETSNKVRYVEVIVEQYRNNNTYHIRDSKVNDEANRKGSHFFLLGCRLKNHTMKPKKVNKYFKKTKQIIIY
jgi:hypothetical protein